MSAVAYEGGIAMNIGTTYSRVAVWENDNGAVAIPDKYGNYAIPSCVAFTDTGILVGQEATEQAEANPKNTVFAVKELLGCEFDNLSVEAVRRQYSFTVIKGDSNRPWIQVKCENRTKECAPEEITAMLLMELKNMAETHLHQKVEKVVLTVPAIFNVQERNAMLDAARIAGIKVLQLLNDTTAAAIAYKINNRVVDGKNRNVVFVEFGGSRLSVSLLAIHRHTIKVKMTDGWYSVGGENFTQSLVKHCVSEFQRNNMEKDISENPHVMHSLYVACEKAKCYLSSEMDATIELDRTHDGISFKIAITRGEFEKICKASFSEFIEAVKEMQEFLDEHGIIADDVVLMGGSTYIPKVRQILADAFGGKGKLNTNTHPEEAVVLAAALRSFALNGGKSENAYDLAECDRTLRVFGIQSTQAGSIRKKIFDKNTPLPAEKGFSYNELCRNGFGKNVYVIEGGNSFFWRGAHSAMLDLSHIPITLNDSSKIEIIFALDASGIPTVWVAEKDSDRRIPLLIKNAFPLEENEVKCMTDVVAKLWGKKEK